MIKLLTTSFVLLLLFSCGNRAFSSLEEYREWIFSEESGYHQVVKTKEIELALTYVPFNANSETISDTNELTNYAFQLKIEPYKASDLLRLNIKDEEAYVKRVSQLEFGMLPLFYAIAEDTLQASLVHYENYRGLKNEVLIHVHFEMPKQLKKDLRVYFKDDVFQTGIHEFSFDTDKLNNPPPLKIENS